MQCASFIYRGPAKRVDDSEQASLVEVAFPPG
jgi:hypothetical protein